MIIDLRYSGGQCNRDILIALLIIFQFFNKGQQDLQEVVEAWTQAPHIMSKHFKEAIKERPKDFMSKFLSGHD